jgi:nucleolar protein 56
MTKSVVTTWFGALLVEDRTVVRSVLAPSDLESLRARVRQRRSGAVTAEEISLLETRGGEVWTTRDRRLIPYGLRLDPRAPGEVDATTLGIDPALGREMLLGDAETSLAEAWDPSIHVQEAVRAESDLVRVRNLVGERLGSWVARDRPEVDPGDHARAARAVMEEGVPSTLAPTDASIVEARRRLAELYREVEATRRVLADAVEGTVPRDTPNLCALLGPELAARLVAQAGGLDRLARLPSSTVQVLGAERAFFEHLRGHAPPPRHGLLFTHKDLQSAPRQERGKLARALAGKVSIAARLDRARAPLDPSLLRTFDSRRDELKARRGASGARKRPSGPRLPLDRAPRDR